jgi:general secretion pathway protein J
MFGAMRLGLRAWEKGEKDSGLGHRIRIVKTQMKHQISSVCTRNVLDSDTGLEPVAFGMKGTENSLEFISDYAISPETEMKPVYVKYTVQKTDVESLTLFEKEISTLTDKEFQDLQADESKDGVHVLLNDIHDAGFEYLKQNMDGTSEWQKSWGIDLKKTNGFPVAVKINFVIDDTPVSLTVKIMSEYESELKNQN